MGTLHVHEFMSLDGVVDTPSWTFDFGFDPKMGELLGGLTDPTWRNPELVGPYDPATIRALRQDGDGDLYVSGSITLVRALLADGLVDALHPFVYPLTLGAGKRLFGEDSAPGKLELAGTESYANGVVYLGYRPLAGG